MPKIIVFHRGYGCETGCCGHAIQVDGVEVEDSFEFGHPWVSASDERGTVFRRYAEELITDKLGAEHIADLDWENCVVLDGDYC